MQKNTTAPKVEEIKDPAAREALRYVLAELDRIKSLPPVTEDLKQVSTIINKITRKL